MPERVLYCSLIPFKMRITSKPTQNGREPNVPNSNAQTKKQVAVVEGGTEVGESFFRLFHFRLSTLDCFQLPVTLIPFYVFHVFRGLNFFPVHGRPASRPTTASLPLATGYSPLADFYPHTQPLHPIPLSPPVSTPARPCSENTAAARERRKRHWGRATWPGNR